MYFWLHVNLWYLLDYHPRKIWAKFRYNVNNIKGASIKKGLLIGYLVDQSTTAVCLFLLKFCDTIIRGQKLMALFMYLSVTDRLDKLYVPTPPSTCPTSIDAFGSF